MAPPPVHLPGRSTVASRVHEHLLVRRALPLAVLILWGCLLVLDFVIHPTAVHGETYRGALPFFGAGGAGIDYYQFWIVGRAPERPGGPENIYAPQSRRHMARVGRDLSERVAPPSKRLADSARMREDQIETFSTPFLYAVINALRTGDYDADYDRYLNICVAATIVAIVALAWSLKFSLAESLLFIATVVLWCQPLTSDLRVGNVNQLQLLGVALYVSLRRCSAGQSTRGIRPVCDIVAGMVLGFLVAFKPTLAVIPLLLALAWVIDRCWSTLLVQGLAATLAAAIAVVTGSLYLHSASAWWDWKNALADLEKVSDVSLANGNFSLARLILETHSPGFDVGPVLLLAGLGIAGLALLATRRRYFTVLGTAEEREARFDRDYLATALGCALSVVTLKLAWLHYYVLLIPLLLYLLRPGSWMHREMTAGQRQGLWLPVAGLILALLALGATFGRPAAMLFNPAPANLVYVYIAGAWGLLLLGLAAMFAPASSGAKPSLQGKSTRSIGKN